MKKLVTLLLVSICVASLFLTISSNVQGQTSEGMEVVSYSWYTSAYSGYFVVVGEVKNVGSEALGSSVLTGTVVTSDQQQQALSEYTLIYSATLLPGETAPFYMMFTPASSTGGNLSWVSLGIDHIDFNFYNTATQNVPYSGLFIGANASSIDMSGNYTVEGIVVNRGEKYPDKVWVVAAFYDVSGKVVAVGYSNYLSPHYLPPAQTAMFKLMPTDPTSQMASQIVSYKLQALSDGVVDTPPTSSPTPSPVPTTNPTATPTGYTGSEVTPPPENGLYVSMTTVYVIVAAVAIAVAIVVVAFVLRKKSKR